MECKGWHIIPVSGVQRSFSEVNAPELVAAGAFVSLASCMVMLSGRVIGRRGSV